MPDAQVDAVARDTDLGLYVIAPVAEHRQYGFLERALRLGVRVHRFLGEHGRPALRIPQVAAEVPEALARGVSQLTRVERGHDFHAVARVWIASVVGAEPAVSSSGSSSRTAEKVQPRESPSSTPASPGSTRSMPADEERRW
jgi:hypothetical protein